MKVIYKYEIFVIDAQALVMQKDAEILCVKEINGEVYIYAYVDDESDRAIRYFEVYGTGHQIATNDCVNRKYIGTFQKGDFVGHLFEDIKG